MLNQTDVEVLNGDLPEAPLKRELGLFSAVMLVAGVVIGSGIFIVSAPIAKQLPSPGWMLLVWVFTGIVTVMGATSYSYLARAYPQAGGQYVFLKQAWGEIPAFLYGWALFLVIQTGTLAAVAVAFSRFLGVLCPWVSSANMVLKFTDHIMFSSQQVMAAGLIIFLTLFNIIGVKQGAFLNNIFTVLKVLALFALIAIGFFFTGKGLPNPGQWSTHFVYNPSLPLAGAFAVATIGALFSSDAWNNVTFIGSEIKHPSINVPKAMIIGTILVVSLYLLVNVAYLNILPFDLLMAAPEDRVATSAVSALWGGMGARAMAIIILVSTFGCLSAMILAGARVFYAMSQDGLFFDSFQHVHPRFKTPFVSLLGQGAIAVLLTLSGTYGDLLNYIVFTLVIFYMATVVGLLKLSRTNASELGLTKGYQYVIPFLYLLSLLYVSVSLLIYAPQFSITGFALVLVGIPIYFGWKALKKKTVPPVSPG